MTDKQTDRENSILMSDNGNIKFFDPQLRDQSSQYSGQTHRPSQARRQQFDSLKKILFF